MQKKAPPVAAIHVCQQCSLQPKARLANGRKAPNPAAQQFTRDLHHAIAADPRLSGTICVRATRCQGVCDTPVGFSFNAREAEAWQWSGAVHRLDVAAVVAIARTYLYHVQTGLRVGKDMWPEGAAKCFMARIPAFPRPAKWPRGKG